jgi:hypothetical protein
MTQLYFCTDGVMRIRSKDEKHMFAVKFVQETEDLSDLSFWMKWWNQSTVFEKGLTFSQFFKCIEPWIDFWSEYTQKDLKSYLQEIRKPQLVTSQNNNLDWLSLDYRN